MMRLNLNIKLLLAFCILLAGTIAADSLYRKRRPMDSVEKMNQAVELASEWFTIIEDLKTERNVVSDASSNVPNSFMIGDEWTEMTTSLGSLQAKEISSNPDFAALIVRLMDEAGVQEADRVGLIVSGSFPSLAISSLAALQVSGNDVILMSSLGASTYGANQADVTWLDMEEALIRRGGLKYRSMLVSMGADYDAGYGILDEGREMIQGAADRNNIELYIPDDIIASIEKRVEIMSSGDISLLINIGGNQASMGTCAHTLSIPNGLNMQFKVCDDADRGVISRMSEQGVPFINLLDMKNLASSYGIDMAPGNSYSRSTNLYTSTQSNKTLILVILLIALVPVALLRKRDDRDEYYFTKLK